MSDHSEILWNFTNVDEEIFGYSVTANRATVQGSRVQIIEEVPTDFRPTGNSIYNYSDPYVL